MKTSNQLLIGLIVMVFAAIFGTATVLKSEYDKIDKDDPYYGYITLPQSEFSAIKMEGKYPALIQIQSGEQFEIKTRKPSPNSRNSENAYRLVWKVENDTLVLSYDAPDFPKRFMAESALARKPILYIVAPQITSVQAESFTCKLSGWDLPNLEIIQQGENSGMALTESSIENLSATVTEGGMMLIEQPNRIAKAKVEVRDVSTFTARPSAIDSLEIDIDQEAQVTISGELFKALFP